MAVGRWWICVFIAFAGGITLSQASRRLADDLLSFDVIQPSQLHPNRVKRDLSTRIQNGHLPSTRLLLSSNKYGVTFEIRLHLNKDLFGSNYHERYQLPGGKFARTKGSVNHCYYHGSVSGMPNSSAAFSTCEGLRGVVYDGSELYHVHPAESSASQDHIFFSSKDVKPSDRHCGVEGEKESFLRDMLSNHNVMRRATTASEMNHVSLVMVMDNRIMTKYNFNKTKAFARAIELSNYMDMVYKTINVRIALVMVEGWNIYDLIHVSADAGETLSNFKEHNREVLSKKKLFSYDNAQFITGIDFAGSTVGMAGVGTICTDASCGVNMDHSSASSVSANTVAHELGHNLGMGHDDSTCTCNTPPCVMTPSASSSKVNGFSDCSLNSFQKKIKSGVASCLFDVPSKLFGDPVCGNDYLERGEECDCGNALECRLNGGDACCNSTTCKLKPSAQCAVGPCCDKCKFKTQGILCRGNQTECDLPEYCTGMSEQCPSNFYRQDGMDCANGQAYCYDGGCRTLDDQCLTLWGRGARRGADICFTRLNAAGDAWGHCGQDLRSNYIKCGPRDGFCGKLQCQGMDATYPIIGTSKSVRTFKFGGNPPTTCKAGITSLGDDLEDPTVAQRGTKCDTNHICLNHTCVNITTIESIKSCPGGCANGGVCNNLGHCHCKVGFSCPDCIRPGVGGSVDSGQGCSLPDSGMSSTTKALLVLFLLVVPLLVLLAFLAYRYRDKLRRSGIGSAFTKRPQRRSFSQLTDQKKARPQISGPHAAPEKPKVPPTAPYSAEKKSLPPTAPAKPLIQEGRLPVLPQYSKPDPPPAVARSAPAPPLRAAPTLPNSQANGHGNRPFVPPKPLPPPAIKPQIKPGGRPPPPPPPPKV